MQQGEAFLWVAMIFIIAYLMVDTLATNDQIKKLDERVTNIELSKDSK